MPREAIKTRLPPSLKGIPEDYLKEMKIALAAWGFHDHYSDREKELITGVFCDDEKPVQAVIEVINNRIDIFNARNPK